MIGMGVWAAIMLLAQMAAAGPASQETGPALTHKPGDQ
jgi:hypothetical protein